MSALLMASWAMKRPYGIFAASMTSTCGGSSASRSRGPSRSAMTTSASASRRRPRTVIRSGSPGPAADEGDPGGAGALVRSDEGAVAQALHDRVADGGGVAGVAVARARGEYGDGDALAVPGRGGPGSGLVGVVGPDAPDTVALGLGGGGGVGVGVAGGDQGVPGVREVAVRVRALLPGDLTRVRHGLDGGVASGETRRMSAPAAMRGGRGGAGRPARRRGRPRDGR